MLPMQDLNPRRRTPILTYALILLNVIVFIWELSFSQSQLEQVFQQLSVVPAEASRAVCLADNS